MSADRPLAEQGNPLILAQPPNRRIPGLTATVPMRAEARQFHREARLVPRQLLGAYAEALS
jgi:hypothetical protein